MTAAVDSSVLVAAIVDAEDHHEACYALLDQPGLHALSHAFVETFSNLSGGRFRGRLGADQVAQIIETSLAPSVQAVILSFEETLAAMKEARSRGVRGGAIYDYLHLVAARKISAERLYTLNLADFRSFWRPGDPEIMLP